MKKLFAVLLAVVMVVGLCACSVSEKPAETTAATTAAATEGATEAATEAAPTAASEITLWTYPIGGWGNQETVDALMADFEAATGIKVTVEYLTYADGDDKVNTAIEGNAAPDLIMEGPERLSPTGAPRASWSTSLTCSTTPTSRRSTLLLWPPASPTTTLLMSIPWS